MTKNNKISKTARKTARKKSRTVKKTRRIRVLNKNKGGGFKQEGGVKHNVFNVFGWYTSEQRKRITQIKDKAVSLHRQLHRQAEPHGTHQYIQSILEIYKKCVDLIFDTYKMKFPRKRLAEIDTDFNKNAEDVVNQAKKVIALLPGNNQYKIEAEAMIELKVGVKQELDDVEVHEFSAKSRHRYGYVHDIVDIVDKAIVDKFDDVKDRTVYNSNEYLDLMIKLFYFDKMIAVILDPFVVMEGDEPTITNKTTITYKVVDDPDIISNNVNEFFNGLFDEISKNITIITKQEENKKKARLTQGHAYVYREVKSKLERS